MTKKYYVVIYKEPSYELYNTLLLNENFKLVYNICQVNEEHEEGILISKLENIINEEKDIEFIFNYSNEILEKIKNSFPQSKYIFNLPTNKIKTFKKIIENYKTSK